LQVIRTPFATQWRLLLDIIIQTGVKAIPIVSLLCFLIGIVLCYQIGSQLRIYGANIFARDIDHFITIRPTFAKMKAEISEFFDYSNKSLYATEPRDSAKIIQNLVHLSKALRDCERGV